MNYLYYKLYNFCFFIETMNTPKSMMSPHWTAAFTFSILLGFNFLEILILYLSTLDNLEYPSLGYLDAIIITIILYTLSYFLFIHKKRYLKIKEYFDNKPKNNLYDALFWVYLFLTLSTLFVIIPITLDPVIKRG